MTEPKPLVPWLLPLLGHGVQILAPIELFRSLMEPLDEVSLWRCGGEVEDPYPVVDGCLRRHPGLSDPVPMSGYNVCTVRRRFILLVWLVESEDGRSVRERRRRF